MVDAKGKLLEVGDRVVIPGTVKEIRPYLGYCNIEVYTDYVMPPDNQKSTLSVNTNQVEKV